MKTQFWHHFSCNKLVVLGLLTIPASQKILESKGEFLWTRSWNSGSSANPVPAHHSTLGPMLEDRGARRNSEIFDQNDFPKLSLSAEISMSFVNQNFQFYCLRKATICMLNKYIGRDSHFWCKPINPSSCGHLTRTEHVEFVTLETQD